MIFSFVAPWLFLKNAGRFWRASFDDAVIETNCVIQLCVAPYGPYMSVHPETAPQWRREPFRCNRPVAIAYGRGVGEMVSYGEKERIYFPAMLRECEVDSRVLWSQCRATYLLTANSSSRGNDLTTQIPKRNILSAFRFNTALRGEGALNGPNKDHS